MNFITLGLPTLKTIYVKIKLPLISNKN